MSRILFFIFIHIFFCTIVGNLRAQFPEFGTFQPISTENSYQSQNNFRRPNGFDEIKRNSEAEQQRIFEEGQRQLKEYHKLKEEERQVRQSVSYSFPKLDHLKGTEHYYAAYDSISAMLDGKRELDLIKSVYWAENAHFTGTMAFDFFNDKIQEKVKFCKDLLKQRNYKGDDKVAVNMVLHAYLSDTTKIKDSNKKAKVSYPLKYDFDDFMGHKDLTKTFVTKLLVHNSGQCHSMPLLYLMMAQELATEAHLAYSPSHSYIMFQDNKNRWNSLELTNGKLITEAAILGSGFIKAEALASKLYMEPLSKKQTVANSLTDLALSYATRYGLDDFFLKCINKVLEQNPNDIFALGHKSDYYTHLTAYISDQLGRPSFEEFKRNYKANEVLNKRDGVYAHLDELGYEKMPDDKYKVWLSSLDKEIEKQKKEENKKPSKQNFNIIEVKQ